MVLENILEIRLAVKAITEVGIQPCVTTDIWTSKGFIDSYISFTIHFVDHQFVLKNHSLGALPFNESHTGINIIAKLEQIWTKTLDLNTTFSPILVTDAAANMQLAARLQSSVYWVRCILHTFHLAINKGIDTCKTRTNMFDKLQAVSSHFGQSYKRMQTFLNIQRALINKQNVTAVELH